MTLIHSNTYGPEDTFFVSAVQHEIFNRIFPTIRHDLVGYMSASLMRISMMKKLLDKPETTNEKFKTELSKIDEYIRCHIEDIRELAFWDFAKCHNDKTNTILKKSAQLISTQLATKGIEINIVSEENGDFAAVESKPLLFSLLCIFGYIEDNDFENHIFNVIHSSNTITFRHVLKAPYNSTQSINGRLLTFTQDVATKFAKLHSIEICFTEKEIVLRW